MKARKIVIASCLLTAWSITTAFRDTAVAQQSQESSTGRVTPGSSNVPQEGAASTALPFINSGGSSGGVGVIFEGEMNVPEDEHLETWISRALAIYAQTDDKDSREQQREEIAKGLDKIFDLRQQQRNKELQELEARVEKLKATLELRATSKSEILKNRLDYLLREADGLGWGDGIPAPKRFGVTGSMFSDPASSAPSVDLSPSPKSDPFNNE